MCPACGKEENHVSRVPGDRSVDGKRRDFDWRSQCSGGQEASRQDNNDRFDAKEK
jgi:hypothetical protein